MFISYITSFLEFICYYIFMKAYVSKSHIPTKTDLFAAIIIPLILSTIPEDYAVASLIIGQIVYIFYFFCTNRNSKGLNNLFLYILTYDTLLAIQFFAALLLSLFPAVINSPHLGIWGNFLVMCLSLLLCLCKPAKIFSFISEAAVPFRFVLLNTHLILVSILLFLKTNPNRLYTNISAIIITTFILIVSNAIVLYYDQKMNLQRHELSSYQKNLPIYESLINEIRNSQHEYSNRLQNLQTLSSTCTNYDELKKCIQTYTYEYSKPLHAYPLLQIDKPLLAATLYNLSCQAEKKDIGIQFDVVSDKLESHASEVDLSDYLSILMQNAIEACSPGDKIYVHLSSADGQTQFEIRNPVPKYISSDEITNFFKNGYTTKALIEKRDNVPHGAGLNNLLKSVTRKKGTVGADCIEHAGNYWMIFNLQI